MVSDQSRPSSMSISEQSWRLSFRSFTASKVHTERDHRKPQNKRVAKKKKPKTPNIIRLEVNFQSNKGRWSYRRNSLGNVDPALILRGSQRVNEGDVNHVREGSTCDTEHEDVLKEVMWAKKIKEMALKNSWRYFSLKHRG